MKTRIFFLGFLLSLAAQISFAQELVSLNVIYEFKYVRDLAKKDSNYVSNMVLSIGKTTSRYCTESEYENSINNPRKKQQQTFADPARPVTSIAGGPIVFVGKYGVAIREEIIKNIGTQKLEVNGFVGTKTYTVETALPKINWTLHPEKKVIGKDTCQKATGSYAGREYEAWFAPHLPFPDGPWKLNGLPGLILEARDMSNEVIFTFKRMLRSGNNNETVAPLIKNQFSIKTNLKNYTRNKMSYEEDPEAMIIAEHPEAKIYIHNPDDPGSRNVVKIRKYNPIEKTE
jgi:GLPGLI family protein